MGGSGKMLMFAYKVSGWVWQDAYVIKSIIPKTDFECDSKTFFFVLFRSKEQNLPFSYEREQKEN